MKRIGLFIGIPLVLFIGTAFAQFNRSMMLATGSGAGITITSASLSGSSYTSGATSGTNIGTASATLSSGSFAVPPGSWSTSGTNAAEFSFSSASLTTNGSTPTCSVTTTIPVNIVASYPGASPFTQAETITCNPASVGACNNNPPVPTPAAAAGYTSLVFCADFTQASYATQSNWLGNCGATSPQFWANVWFQPSGTFRCSAYVMVTDAGKQVLDIQYNATDKANSWQSNVLTSCNAPDCNTSSLHGIFPNMFFAEFRLRVPQTTLDRMAGGSLTETTNVWANSAIVNSSHTHIGPEPEWDFLEEWTNGFQSSQALMWVENNAFTNNCLAAYGGFTGECGAPVASFDQTTWHTFSVLAVQDGTNFSYCGWLDGTFTHCASTPTDSPSPSAESMTDLQFLQIDSPDGRTATAFPLDLYLQYFRMWACPTVSSSQTQNCNHTLITTNPGNYTPPT